jgi:glyoxylate/hydroxypyruvate reductase A
MSGKTLRIAIAHPDKEASERWQRALNRLLPQASSEPWQPGAEPADYAVGWFPEAGFFAEQPRLRALFSAGAGVDHLLKHSNLPEQLPIIRLEDAGMGQQMVEYCLHEALRVQRRFDEYREQQQAGMWRTLPAVPRAELRIGVLGLGVLGAHVAGELARFGYPVRGYSRSAKAVDGIECFDDSHGLQAFLEGCRILIVLAPLTTDTRHLLDEQRLSWLPQGAWLINVARGGLVDDEALLSALDSGRLAGATLDVFHEEPLPPAHRFWGHPKVRITPHVSAVTVAEESAKQVAAKIVSLERGEAVSGLVDRHRGY